MTDQPKIFDVAKARETAATEDPKYPNLFVHLCAACDRIEQLEEYYDDVYSKTVETAKERDQLKERVSKLEEALSFYARRRSYDIGMPESEEPNDVYRDNGQRARNALAKNP